MSNASNQVDVPGGSRTGLVVLGLLVLAVIVWGSRGREGGGAPASGGPCPAFEVITLDGETISPESLRGQVVLIDFWATWCGPCLRELPHVAAIYDEHHESGFEILGISLDQDLARLDGFLEANPQVAWPQVCDGKAWRGKLVELFGVDSIPRTILLDRRGEILAVGLRGRDLARAVSREM